METEAGRGGHSNRATQQSLHLIAHLDGSHMWKSDEGVPQVPPGLRLRLLELGEWARSARMLSLALLCSCCAPFCLLFGTLAFHLCLLMSSCVGFVVSVESVHVACLALFARFLV